MLCRVKTFLLPLLSQPYPEVEEENMVEHVPSPISSSVLGQPPSAPGDVAETLDCDLNSDLQKLYKNHGLEDDFVLNETIDDKRSSLMDGQLRLNFSLCS